MAAIETLPRGVTRPAFEFRVDVIDETIPALRAVARATDARFGAANRAATELVKFNIKKAFLTGQRRWKPLATSTIRKKRRIVPWPTWILHETLTLHRNVMNIKVEARAVGSKKAGGRFVIRIPEESFWSTPYVKFHEEGTATIPKRSFLQEGIEASGPVVAEIYAEAMASLVGTVREPKKAGIAPQKYKQEDMLFKSRLGLMGWLFLFAPPSGLWAIVGASADLRGLISGDFNSAAIKGFLWQWMLGYGQLTEKMWRRKMRRVVWA